MQPRNAWVAILMVWLPACVTALRMQREDAGDVMQFRSKLPPLTIELGALSGRYPEVRNALPSRPTYQDLVHHLYQDKNPMDLFVNPRQLKFAGDLKWSHIGANPGDVKALIDLANASFVVETGCYVGTSTKKWSEYLQSRGEGGTVLAIDAWVGDLASWVDRIDLNSRSVEDDVLFDGRSALYDQFMLNMQQNQITNVVPLVTTSITGARWLATMNYVPDLVYVDTAHEQGETIIELELYWNLLKQGGVLCGDDYDWAAVKHDVNDFAERHQLKLEFAPSGSTWFVRKLDGA